MSRPSNTACPTVVQTVKSVRCIFDPQVFVPDESSLTPRRFSHRLSSWGPEPPAPSWYGPARYTVLLPSATAHTMAAKTAARRAHGGTRGSGGASLDPVLFTRGLYNSATRVVQRRFGAVILLLRNGGKWSMLRGNAPCIWTS
jgi:hypothetical protein